MITENCQCGAKFEVKDGDKAFQASRYGEFLQAHKVCREDKPDKWKEKFPSLDKCLEKCRTSVTGDKLTDNDEHMIGTAWAFIANKLDIPYDE